jgi:hypothetical protein
MDGLVRPDRWVNGWIFKQMAGIHEQATTQKSRLPLASSCSLQAQHARQTSVPLSFGVGNLQPALTWVPNVMNDGSQHC